MRKLIFILFLVTVGFSFRAQVNLVGNPSFEDTVSTTYPNCISKVKYWTTIDSSWLCGGGKIYSNYFGVVPYDGLRYQYPRTGKAMLIGTQYCVIPCVSPNIIQYPKNRLKVSLTASKVYCAKMYVNIGNNSTHGNDAFAMYFGDATIDTIKYCGIHLTYLTPQVKNPTGNIITDTLNWTLISGTFTATGNEKYLVLGNFLPDAAVNTTFINGWVAAQATDVYYDDISVVEFDLPASAGPDKNIFLGDSAFVGRPPEIGLECTWSSGTVSVGSGGGLWVKPTSPGTYSYVVTQNICGNIKTDTVNVNVSPSSINENTLFSNSISIYPQPASELVTISLNYFYEKSIEVRVLDVNARLVRSSELGVRSGKAEMQISDLADGVYAIQLKNSSGQWAVKRLVVAR